MHICRWLLVGMTLLFSACGGKVQPTLELDGHWVVGHGFDDDCRVTASFYDNQMMVLSFYSLVAGACQAERYGIEGDAVMIDITAKKDYFDGDGVLATEVQMFVHDLWLKGTLRLTEAPSGLRAVVVSSEDDATGMLNPLFNKDFNLTAVPTDWFPLLRGRWGVGCDPAKPSGVCEILEFQSDVLGRHRLYEKCNDNFTCDINLSSTDFFYAVRNIEKLADGRYIIDIVVFGPGSGDGPAGETLTLILSDERLEMVGFETLTRLEKLPIVH